MKFYIKKAAHLISLALVKESIWKNLLHKKPSLTFQKWFYAWNVKLWKASLAKFFLTDLKSFYLFLTHVSLERHVLTCTVAAVPRFWSLTNPESFNKRGMGIKKNSKLIMKTSFTCHMFLRIPHLYLDLYLFKNPFSFLFFNIRINVTKMVKTA